MTSKRKTSKISESAQPTANEPVMSAEDRATQDHAELISRAVADGQASLAQGSTKIDAAMVIFRQIDSLPQQVVLKAFVEGATLTERGALTYWYTCRRKLARERRTQ